MSDRRIDGGIEFETIVLARIPRGERSEVRVAIVEWEGVRSLDMRTWNRVRDADDYRPTPRGARIPLDRVPELAVALQAAINGTAIVKTGDNVVGEAYNSLT